MVEDPGSLNSSVVSLTVALAVPLVKAVHLDRSQIVFPVSFAIVVGATTAVDD